MTLHHDEFDVGDDLVRGLVELRLPQFAGAPLHRLPASGSTNALYRLGDDLLVRLPRQPGGSEAIEKEARWLPQIGPYLRVAVPEPVAVGEPGLGYPERWSVVRWIEGDPPSTPVPDGPRANDLAGDLARVVAALREVDVPHGAQDDPALRSYRSRPLAAFDAAFRRYLAQCRDLPGLDLDIDACGAAWDAAVALPDLSGTARPRWVHGDLLAENLLVRDGRLAAVLDFGALSVGDPSVDLVVAWEVVGPGARDVFRSVVSVDEAGWLRGRAWALAIAIMTFPYYWHTMPGRCADRLVLARAVLADA